MKADSDKKLLTAEEFADWTGMKLPTVRLWIARRRISSVKLGPRAVRIPVAEIDRLIERGLRPALLEPHATSRHANPAAAMAGALRPSAARLKHDRLPSA